ncbi:MAG: C39 family peptidase [Pirellulaceae bacterium]|nr:C39 family peptidase [Pirellulaceae bacterium]
MGVRRRLILIFYCSVALADTGWLDVPYVRQVKAGCGAAAVAMVVQYWARHHPELKDAAAETANIDELLPASRRGIRGSVLKDYLAQRGFNAFVFDGEMKDLRHHFEKGRPVVVCLGLSGAKGPLHYAVVVGVDDKTVWLNDSARGKLVRDDLESFEKAWRLSENWAMLAVPRPR